MALNTVVISYNIADLVGADFDPRRTKVWVSTNVPDATIVDPASGQVRLGEGFGTIAEDGTGSVEVWAAGASSQPFSWQTFIHVDYAPNRPGAARVRCMFGPYTVTEDTTLANLIATQDFTPTVGVEYGVIHPRPTLFPGFLSRTVTFRKLGTSRFISDYNIDADRPPTGVTYYASPTGTYGAAGTEAAPTTFSGAHDKTDVGTIRLLPGEYFNNQTDKITTKPLNIIGPGDGSVLFTGFRKPSDLTWTVQSGSIYQATISGNEAQWVIDKRPGQATAWNDAATYQKKANLAAITGPGQWAYVGGVVYAWALGNANLATDASFLRVSQGGFVGIIVNGAHRVYLEGFEMQGCGWASQGLNAVDQYQNSRAVLLAKDMRFRYCPLSGWRPAGSLWSAIIDCEASSCGGDGFGYQASSTDVLEFLEVDSYSHHHYPSDPANVTLNGSTSHDGCVGVRLQTRANHTYGPGIVDVGGAKTWNLACESRDNALVGNAQSDGFQCYGDGTTEVEYGRMFLDSCDSSGNDVGVNVLGNATIYITNPGPGGNVTERLVESTGAIVDY